MEIEYILLDDFLYPRNLSISFKHKGCILRKMFQDTTDEVENGNDKENIDVSIIPAVFIVMKQVLHKNPSNNSIDIDGPTIQKETLFSKHNKGGSFLGSFSHDW